MALVITHKKNIIKSRNVLCVFDALERHMWRYVRRPCYVAALVFRTPQFTGNSLSELEMGRRLSLETGGNEFGLSEWEQVT